MTERREFELDGESRTLISGLTKARPPRFTARGPAAPKPTRMTKRGRDDLECPVCFDQMTAPIYQCVNGHLICRICVGLLEKSTGTCPTCRVPLIDRIRCLQADRRAEELLESRSRKIRAEAPTTSEGTAPSSGKRGLAMWSRDACPSPVSMMRRSFEPSAPEHLDVCVYKVADDGSELWPELEGVSASRQKTLKTTVKQLSLTRLASVFC